MNVDRGARLPRQGWSADPGPDASAERALEPSGGPSSPQFHVTVIFFGLPLSSLLTIAKAAHRSSDVSSILLNEEAQSDERKI